MQNIQCLRNEKEKKMERAKEMSTKQKKSKSMSFFTRFFFFLTVQFNKLSGTKQ